MIKITYLGFHDDHAYAFADCLSAVSTQTRHHLHRHLRAHALRHHQDLLHYLLPQTQLLHLY